MKNSIRILCLLLAMLLSFSVFVACDKTPEETEAKATPTETETEEVHPTIAKKNYNTDFFMTIQQDVNKPKYHWVEESENDALSEAIYARQEKVHEYLGVEITATEGGSHTTYTENFKNAIKNKDDSVHLMLTHVHSGIEGLISGNYLRDYTTIDEIDIEGEHWNQKFMEGLALNDRMYLGNSNFNILYTHVVAYNKTMLDQYDDALTEDVYSMVLNKHWTLDQMISLASLVYVDKTADGKTSDDTFGLTGVQWVPFIGLLHASNIQYIDVDETGSYSVSVYNSINQSKTAALVEKLSEMVKSDYAWFRYRIEDTPEVPLSTGRALMTLASTNDLESLCEYDIDFGVLPYPMFDEAQANVGYRHLQWGGYTVIPAYSADPVMVAETIEVLSYFSDEVNVTFYEKLLGKQVADAPLDRQMLDIVWDTICSEFGQAYTECSGNWLYMLPEITQVNATQNLASYVKSKESSSNKKIKKFLLEVAKLGE
jgi:hypothetical protein